MKTLSTLQKALGFLISVVLAASATSCNSNTNENESSIEENSISDTTNNVDISETSEATEAEPISMKKTSYSDIFSERDLNPDFSIISTEISLNGDAVSADGTGVYIDGSIITITQEGIYKVSGSLNDGQIIVNAPDAKVQIILDNANVNCTSSSAIYGVDSKKIFISLAENSVNTLTDGEYIYSDDSTEPDSCIFSKDSLTINGSGTLNINSTLTGIHGKDDVVITGGNINITAAKDGIKGKDYIAVYDGSFNITSNEDSLKSTNATDTSLGYIYIENGDFTLDSAQDSIQAETDLIILDGTFNIISGGGSENSTKIHSNMDFKDDNFNDKEFHKGGFNHNDFGNMTPPDDFNGKDFGDMGGSLGGGRFNEDFNPENFGDMQIPDNFENITPPEMKENKSNDSTDNSNTVSTKGIKGGTAINIYGGYFNIDSADDAIHSANVNINDGNITISTGNKGIHADSNLCIDGGTINITDSYEGIEGDVINVSGGDLTVNATDDGFNASDGVTNQDGMGTYSDGVALNISGGSVYVNADGDGLDSNGDMTISGGNIIVDGPTNGGNGALDGNSEIIVTGGTLIAVGSSQMAECPSNSSTQYVVSATFDSTQQADTSVKLLDENGNEIINFTSAKTFDNIIISSPDILKDKTYTFYLNNAESESFTASEIISTIGKQSSMGSGFGGGMGGFGGGGRGNKGDFQPPANENGEFEMPDRDFGEMPINPDINL